MLSIINLLSTHPSSSTGCLVQSDPHASHSQGHKAEKEEGSKEVNGVAEKEEEVEEDDDEEDESSDPDIEEEIQASTQQDGPGYISFLSKFKSFIGKQCQLRTHFSLFLTFNSF